MTVENTCYDTTLNISLAMIKKVLSLMHQRIKYTATLENVLFYNIVLPQITSFTTLSFLYIPNHKIFVALSA